MPGFTTGRLNPLAWSADGSKLAAVYLFGNAVFTSTNYGATWTSNSIPTGPWWQIASSADGTKLVTMGGGLVEPGPIYYSADSGQTWAPANAPITNWVSVASSANGSNWVAAVAIANSTSLGGLIYTSTDCGKDWTLLTNAPDNEWLSIASSADGTRFVAADSRDHAIYTSPDSGQTWHSTIVSNEYWANVASSADGRTLVASAYANISNGNGNGDIYSSTNAGLTWVSNSVPAQMWMGIAMSADAGLMIASDHNEADNETLYIAKTIPSPTLNIIPTSNSFTLSWLLPSTNFVVQQNSDLTAPNWVTLTNIPTLNFNNLQEQTTVSSSNAGAFFRLTTP